jgi:rod shape determining protein RodA
MSDSPAYSLRGVDPWLVGATAALVAVGIANLHTLGDLQPSRYGGLAARQLVWVVLGGAAGLASFVTARRDRHRALGWVHVAAFGAVLLTLAGFAESIGGVRRWLRLGPLVVQPSEFLKLGVVAAVARWFGDAPIGTRSFGRALLGVLLCVVFPAALVAAQPDLGTGVLLLLVGAASLAFAPEAWRTLPLLVAIVATPALLLGRTLLHGYQLARIRAFLDPDAHPGTSWQLTQALDAMTAGRALGTHAWLSSHLLPGAHTDFALVAWGSAHGLLGTLAVLVLQAVVAQRAFDTASRATERYDLALAAGVGSLLALQVTVNAAMAFGMLPVVGVPMPLVSYGGSNLATTLLALGAVLGVRARIVTTPTPPGAPGPERLYRGTPEA